LAIPAFPIIPTFGLFGFSSCSGFLVVRAILYSSYCTNRLLALRGIAMLCLSIFKRRLLILLDYAERKKEK
jgi:hypothetical protein